MAHHPFVILPLYCTPVEIDEEIAPIIEKLWSVGIATDFCCQGDADDGTEEGRMALINRPNGYRCGYISFPSADEFAAFVEFCGGIRALIPLVDHIYGPDRSGSHRISVYFHNSRLPALRKLTVG